MKLSQDEKFAVETLRNLSGQTIESVMSILKSLMMITLMNYADDEDIIIPYFGKLTLDFKGDEVKNGTRVAKVDTEYIPSDELLLNIGLYEDIKEQGGKITDLPIIKDITKDLGNRLRCIMNEESLGVDEKDLEDN